MDINGVALTGVNIVDRTLNIVAGSLLFNLDMQNYVSGTAWPDVSGNGNNFTFYQLPTGSSFGTVVNAGTRTAYWSSPGNNGAQAASAIFPALTNYSKAVVVWTSSGTLNNLIGSTGLETMWGQGTAFLLAGNGVSGSYYEVSANPNAFLTGRWMYLGLSYNTSTGWKLYMNGVQTGASAGSTSRTGASTPQIFSYAGNANQSTGRIAAALLYTRELTAEDHQQNYLYYAARYITPSSVEYLVVAGGGSGGAGTAGGGGAGGFRTATDFAVAAGTPITVTVGGGGAGLAFDFTQGNPGFNSVFSSITAIGGGGGGDRDAAPPANDGLSGGSGGGGGGSDPTAGTGGAGTVGQGNSGGNGKPGAGLSSGGGGGGAGGAGATPTTATGGNGGVGLQFPSGSGTYYAGGGGGGSHSGNSTGGIGGGGRGGGYANSPTAGAGLPNTGGGGGGVGGGSVTGSGAGGNGIVIIRYPSMFADAASTTGSPLFTNSGGFKIYTFTGSGSITF